MKFNLRNLSGLLALLPFTALVAVFMFWPALTVVYKTFFTETGFSVDGIARAVTGTYQSSFWLSIKLSLVTALLGAGFGFLLALVVRQLPVDSKLRAFTDAWSAVASQMGGVPLAFAFLSLLGTQGLLTRILQELGIDLVAAEFSLSDFWGWVLVYMYFQIPLMFLIVTPALNALKPAWAEGATSLGASNFTYWRKVALPILAPVNLTGVLLLFINAFSAYATVYALSNAGGQLVPLQIRFILQGNVITGEKDLGYALVTVSIVLLLIALLLINVLQKRFAKWAEQ